MGNDNNFSFDVRSDENDNYTHLGNEILDCVGLSANKKMIYVMLRRFAGRQVKLDGNGSTPGKLAYPSINTLEGTCGISNSTVIKGIKFFEWLYWLEKKQTKTEKDVWKPNIYILHLENMRRVLTMFKEKDISFYTVEHYYDIMYKSDKKLLFTKQGCIFLSDKYTSEIVNETLKKYEGSPKKKRVIKSKEEE